MDVDNFSVTVTWYLSMNAHSKDAIARDFFDLNFEPQLSKKIFLPNEINKDNVKDYKDEDFYVLHLPFQNIDTKKKIYFVNKNDK